METATLTVPAAVLKIPKGKRRQDVVKLATRVKYQELARRYGDPLEFGFMVMADVHQELQMRLYAMRSILPFGEVRQVGVQVDQRVAGTVEIKLQQDDMFGSTYDTVPELIGGDPDSLPTETTPAGTAADHQTLERVGDSSQGGQDRRGSELAEPPDTGL